MSNSSLLAAMAGLSMAFTWLSPAVQAADKISGPYVGPVAVPHSTLPLRSLPKASPAQTPVQIQPRINPLDHLPDHGLRGTDQPDASASRQRSVSAGNRTPDPLLTFEGQGNNCFCTPPDTVGDVGPNHYVQAVNGTLVAIYDKAGVMAAGFPKQMNALFASGNCAASTRGDPVVLYDSLADRWVLAQFTTAGTNGVCVAVSQTPDPTGAYFGYEFLTPEFPDYLKLGVWNNGYYMSTNENTYAAYSFDRSKMLAGQAAGQIRFNGITNFMLPADVDGATAPPASAPAYFYTFKDDAFHGGSDRLEIYSFNSDFTTPANSTFTLTDTIPIASFGYTVCGFFVLNCIPQGGTAQKVDPVSEWPMFRFAYRNFGSHQSAVGNFTIKSATAGAGAIRWFEVRKTTGNWSLFQEGTLDSNDGVSRWIGSIAMDAFGNIALGYSISSASMFPGIAYAVRLAGDALGTMQAEKIMTTGGGSQTGSSRWGDYSAMNVDPSDDATFWFTTEYYPASASNAWHTRIGAFRVTESMSFNSVAANDGDILELKEFSSTGGTLASAGANVRLGDDSGDRQWRAILDFNTAGLPDTANIVGAKLELTQDGAVTGISPFVPLKPLRFDIKSGAFGGSKALQLQDFAANSSLDVAGSVGATPVGSVFSGKLKSGALTFVNKTGRTQLRLRFKTGDNDNKSADAIAFASGEASAGKPKLTVYYVMP
jgi:hypothetical protein